MYVATHGVARLNTSLSGYDWHFETTLPYSERLAVHGDGSVVIAGNADDGTFPTLNVEGLRGFLGAGGRGSRTRQHSHHRVLGAGEPRSRS